MFAFKKIRYFKQIFHAILETNIMGAQEAMHPRFLENCQVKKRADWCRKFSFSRGNYTERNWMNLDEQQKDEQCNLSLTI